jgi:hypothetical protein
MLFQESHHPIPPKESELTRPVASRETRLGVKRTKTVQTSMKILDSKIGLASF